MAGLQVDVYVSVGITWLAALIALSLRLLARQLTRMRWWFDDYLSILALVRSGSSADYRRNSDVFSAYSSSRRGTAPF
jgi:hypothetical protein